MALQDLSPRKLIVTNPDPVREPDRSDESSLVEQQADAAGPNNIAASGSRKIKRRPASTQTVIYSPVNTSEAKTNDADSSTTRTYDTAEKSQQIPTPLCGASCSGRQPRSPCMSPSSLVAAIEDELRRERLAVQESESKQRIAEDEIQSLKTAYEAAVELCDRGQDTIADLELRIADGEREIERLHGKLDEEYDRSRVEARRRLDESVTADRRASSARSEAPPPLLRRIRSGISRLTLKDPASQTRQVHDLEAQNASLRSEVRGLESAVDKWFAAFEIEKDNHSGMRERYLRETAWVRRWQASAEQALEALERKRKAHDEDIADYNRLVAVLRSRDQEIVALEGERDEMVARVVEAREEVERVAGGKEKWKGWAWRQKRLADGLWRIAVEGCRGCGVGWERRELVAELKERGCSSQVDAEGAVGGLMRREVAVEGQEEVMGG